jgi:phosphohistidine phosphatase
MAGLALARLGLGFEAVLFSPKVRARQTAELAAEAWEEVERSRLSALPALASGFDGGQALDAMAGVGDEGRLMLVGHEPDLSNVVAQLTGGRIDLKKGGLAVLRLDGAGGELAALLRPSELALIADPSRRVLGVPVGGE